MWSQQRINLECKQIITCTVFDVSDVCAIRCSCKFNETCRRWSRWFTSSIPKKRRGHGWNRKYTQKSWKLQRKRNEWMNQHWTENLLVPIDNKERQHYQFSFGSSGLQSSAFGFTFELLLCQWLQEFVALQLLFSFCSHNKDFIIFVIIAQMIRTTRTLLVRMFDGNVVDCSLTEPIDFTYQSCGGRVGSWLTASLLRHAM